MERLPAWMRNKWVLFGLSAGAALIIGLLVFLLFLRGPIATSLTRQGQAALEAEDFSKAADKFSAALTLKSNREEIYLGYANALIGLKDYDEAVQIAEKGIEKMSGAESLYLCKVQALVGAGKIGEAAEFLDNIEDSYINKKIQDERPADLSYSPAQGKYSKTQKVTIDGRDGETIYYTLNGETPTINSTVYKEPITISSTTTLTAIAVSENGLVSPILQLNYEIDNANEAIEFTDTKVEAMVRAALDRPSGTLQASQLTAVTELSSGMADGSIRSLKDLEYLPALKTLSLNNELLIDDYTPLAGLSGLSQLYITGCALSDADLAAVNALTGLTELDISDNCITALDGISALQQLTYLNASDNDIASSSALEAFPNLTYLSLSGNNLSELDGLKNLTDLSTLDISDNYISDLAPLTGLKNLTELFLRNNTPANVKKLASLSSLTYLDISECGLASLSVVSGCTSLKVLLAEGNEIASLSTFKNQVTELYVSNNPLADISPLKNQTGLTVLTAADTQISDVSFLAGSTTLEYLDIANTNVTDATALSSCTALTVLICGESCSTAGLPASLDVILR